MSWSFFQEIHERALRVATGKRAVLRHEDITVEEVDGDDRSGSLGRRLGLGLLIGHAGACCKQRADED